MEGKTSVNITSRYLQVRTGKHTLCALHVRKTVKVGFLTITFSPVIISFVELETNSADLYMRLNISTFRILSICRIAGTERHVIQPLVQPAEGEGGGRVEDI